MRAASPSAILVTIDTERDERFVLDVLDYNTEYLWLPTIGPSAMVLARLLLSDTSERSTYPTTSLAYDLGIGVPRLWEACNRLRRARLATVTEPGWSPMPHLTLHAFWPQPRQRSGGE
jgi:hypothetical protein